MAYNKDEIVKDALAAIKKHKLVFFEEITNYVKPVKKTLYAYKLHDMPEIKDALAENKINTKKYLRDKWKKSDNATVQIALYKLLSNEDEFAKITNYQKNTEKKEENVIHVTGITIEKPKDN